MSDSLKLDYVKRRLAENSVILAACRVASAGIALVVVPVIIRRLGLIGFGVWEVLLAVGILCSMLVECMAGTLVWQTAKAFGSNDMQHTRRVVSLGFTVTLALITVVMPLAWWSRLPAGRVLHVPEQMLGQFNVAFPLIILVSLCTGFSQSLSAAVDGAQRSGLTNVMRTLGQVSNYLVGAALVVNGFGLYGLVLGFIVGFIVTLTGCYATARRLVPSIRLRPGWMNSEELKAMRSYGGLMFIGAVATALRDQTDKLVLSGFASPTWAAYYGVAARLAVFVRDVSNFIYFPTVTASGALFGAGNHDAVKKLYASVVGVVLPLAGVVAVLVAGLSRQLLVLWFDKPMPQVLPILLLLVFGNISAVILTAGGTAIARGIGRVDVETRYIAVNMIVNIVLTIVLVATIGAFGTVIASSISWFVGGVYFLFVLHQHTYLPGKVSWRAATLLATVVVSGAALYWMAGIQAVVASRSWAILSCLFLAAPGLLLYGTGLLVLRLVDLHVVRSFRRTFPLIRQPLSTPLNTGAQGGGA